jgi:hypothetical protein
VTFLPIVERELRAAARRRSAFRIRMGVAILTSLAASAMLLFSYGVSSARLGKGIFLTLSILAFVSCLFEGARLAADCLSAEKRDGTLGLLFLTDLRGYDVVFGKLASISVRSFQGLFAFIPVLAIALILGGVTGGEFWRTTAVLMNTLFFSLCLGLFISCLGREAHKCLIATLAILFTLALMPFLFQKLPLWSNQAFRLAFGSISPGYAGFLSSDLAYAARPGEFWGSLLVTHSLAWLLLMAASLLIPRVWQDREDSAAESQRGLFAWRWLNAPQNKQSRNQMLDQNPFFWLSARNERERRFVWLIVSLICGIWIAVAFVFRSGAVWVATLSSAVIFLLSLVVQVWMALHGSRHLAEARHNQALELFLVTPVRIDELITGQWLAMKHLFLGPALVVVAGTTFALVLQGAAAGNFLGFLPGVAMAIFNIVTFVADLFALWWVGMWMGLSQKNMNQAFAMTILVAMIIPAVIFCIPDVFMDLALINWAKTRLEREFRKIASERGDAAEKIVKKRVAVRAAPNALPPLIGKT